MSENDNNIDLHICGVCKQQFTNIDAFINHKNQDQCSSSVSDKDTTPKLNLGLQEQSEEHMALLRERLLGLAAAAHAEFLEDSTTEHTPSGEYNYRSSFHRGMNDLEEDVADVLANQLSIKIPNQPMNFNTELATMKQEDVVTTLENVEERRITVDVNEHVKHRKKRTHQEVKEKKKPAPRKNLFKCNYPTCKFEGKYFKDLTRHMRIHTGERPFKCEQCGTTFSRNDKLKLHLRIHSGAKNHKCSFCNYASIDNSSLKKHMRIHSDERPCECQLCPYKARDNSQLIVHLRTHTGDCPYICLAPGCDAAFKTSSDLNRHTRIHTNEHPFVCDTCDFKTKIKGNLLTHMRRAHLGATKTYSCNICNNFEAATHSALQQHKRTHAHAGVAFLRAFDSAWLSLSVNEEYNLFFVTDKDSQALLKALKKATPASIYRQENISFDALLRCNVGQCSYMATNNKSMRYHLRNTHPDQSPLLTCKHCSFTCSKNGEMKSHTSENHVKHKKNKTRNQSKITSDDSNIHFKRSFKCSVCSTSFVRSDSLRSHLRVHERATIGAKGVVVVDTSTMNHEDPDDPPELFSDSKCNETIENSAYKERTIVFNNDKAVDPQHMVLYVPSTEHSDGHLFNHASGGHIIDQLNMQPGVQYIVVHQTPNAFTETQPHMFRQ